MQFLCIYSTTFFTALQVSKDYFVHHQDFMIYCIRSSVQTMQTARWFTVSAALYKPCKLLGLTVDSSPKTAQLGTFARFVQSCGYSKSWTPDDEWNSLSKFVEL